MAFSDTSLLAESAADEGFDELCFQYGIELDNVARIPFALIYSAGLLPFIATRATPHPCTLCCNQRPLSLHTATLHYKQLLCLRHSVVYVCRTQWQSGTGNVAGTCRLRRRSSSAKSSACQRKMLQRARQALARRSCTRSTSQPTVTTCCVWRASRARSTSSPAGCRASTTAWQT